MKKNKELQLIEKYLGWIEEKDLECYDPFIDEINELIKEDEELDEASDAGKGGLRQFGINSCKTQLGKIKRYSCLVAVYGKYISRLRNEQSKADSPEKKQKYTEKIKKATERVRNYKAVINAGRKKMSATTKTGKKEAKGERNTAMKKAKKGQGLVRRAFVSSKI